MEAPLDMITLLREQVRLLMDKSKDCEAEEIRENLRVLIELSNSRLFSYL